MAHFGAAAKAPTVRRRLEAPALPKQTLEQYRARVRNNHQAAFALHGEVSRGLEEFLLKPRKHRTHVHLAIDMLMVQSFKSHATVSLLAQHGLMEDTATVARRLLELSVQAVYIGMVRAPKERKRRAGMYIAFMWRDLPRKAKLKLPPGIRRYWTKLGRTYGRLVPAKAKTWGPHWRTQFEAIGHPDLYDLDYSLLSGIAHGRSAEQILNYSRRSIRLHDDRYAGALLNYATRYVLASAEVWNCHYRIMPPQTLQSLIDKAMA